MTTYLWFWTAGGIAGVAAGVLVLRRSAACGLRTLLALGLAWGGFIVGVRLQFRLAHYPLNEAFRLTPADLLAGGHHTPLGFALGAVLVGLYCLAVRAPWRETGDALAVAATVMMAIGRFGCLVAGCCTGTVCGRWARALCVRYPRGSEPFGLQLAAGMIPWDSDRSLPVHPLPLYFVGTALLTLMMLVWLLRRGARPGTVALTFGILEPTTKLCLEMLRGSAPGGPSGLMLAVPLVMLAASGVCLTARMTRRIAPGFANGAEAVTGFLPAVD